MIKNVTVGRIGAFMKKSVLFACTLFVTVAWMLLIFGFSAQSGTESSGLSALIAEPLTRLLTRFSDDMSAAAEAALYAKVDLAVRKMAHFTEYAILGGLLTILFRCVCIRKVWPPVLLGAVYAMTDEWHQSFSPGRTSALLDVLIDSCGALIGALVCHCIIQYWRKKHVYHP